MNPTFSIDKAGTYVVSLIVNNGSVDSTPDTVSISTLNSAPVANAGPDQSVYAGNQMVLNGSNSYDPDGGSMAYNWAFTSKPSCSMATLVNPTAANPTFTADASGNYVISLTVNDGAVDSVPDRITISVIMQTTAAISKVQNIT